MMMSASCLLSHNHFTIPHSAPFREDLSVDVCTERTNTSLLPINPVPPHNFSLCFLMHGVLLLFFGQTTLEILYHLSVK